ncbi:MAG: ribonuclease H family protein, partial [Bacteroidota bacterium]
AESRGVFHPDYSLPFKLRVDACKDGIGAYLFQEVPVVVDMGKERKEERVIEYFSRSLPKSARSYGARKLEMQAVIEALVSFEYWFEVLQSFYNSQHLQFTSVVRPSALRQ